MTDREMLKQARQVEKDIEWLAKHMVKPTGRRKIEKRRVKDAKKFARQEKMYEIFSNIGEELFGKNIIITIAVSLIFVMVAFLIPAFIIFQIGFAGFLIAAVSFSALIWLIFIIKNRLNN